MSCLENGDHAYAAMGFAFATLDEFYRGSHLQQLKDKADRASRTLKRIGGKDGLGLTLCCRHAAR
jgi:hypothetical protein